MVQPPAGASAMNAGDTRVRHVSWHTPADGAPNIARAIRKERTLTMRSDRLKYGTLQIDAFGNLHDLRMIDRLAARFDPAHLSAGIGCRRLQHFPEHDRIDMERA